MIPRPVRLWAQILLVQLITAQTLCVHVESRSYSVHQTRSHHCTKVDRSCFHFLSRKQCHLYEERNIAVASKRNFLPKGEKFARGEGNGTCMTEARQSPGIWFFRPRYRGWMSWVSGPWFLPPGPGSSLDTKFVESDHLHDAASARARALKPRRSGYHHTNRPWVVP